jgi:hypothetical protein
MTDPIETPEILAKAAEVIVERGWHVGNYKDPHSCAVCLLGAISVAAGAAPDAIGTTEAPPAAEAAVAALERWLEPGIDLADWNDEIAEDADEVTTALRECAASLKAGA